MPVLMPGPSDDAGNVGEPPRRHLAQFGRSPAAPTSSRRCRSPTTAMSRPSRSSSWVSSTACSSGVRVGTVERRQWWIRPAARSVALGPDADADARLDPAPCPSSAREEPDDGLGVADVDGEQHQSLTVPRPDRSSPRSSTGAEWVSAPDRDEVGAGRGVGRRPCRGSRRRTPRRGSGTGAPRWAARTAAATLGGRHVVEQHQRRRRRRAASVTWSSVSHSTSTMPARPAALGRGATASVMAMPAEVVVLDEHGVGERARWLVAAAGAHRRLLEGPQARAWSCGCRGPDRRVGRRGPASTKRRVRVATPERWQRKLSAVRSAVRIERSGPVTSTTSRPAASVVAVGRHASRPRPSGRPRRKVSVAQARPASTPSARARARRARSRLVGDQGGGEVADGTEVLGERPGHGVATAGW